MNNYSSMVKKLMLVTDNTIYGIETKINNSLKNGWELYGTMIIDRDGGYNYIQAMTKMVPDQ